MAGHLFTFTPTGKEQPSGPSDGRRGGRPREALRGRPRKRTLQRHLRTQLLCVLGIVFAACLLVIQLSVRPAIESRWSERNVLLANVTAAAVDALMMRQGDRVRTAADLLQMAGLQVDPGKTASLRDPALHGLPEEAPIDNEIRQFLDRTVAGDEGLAGMLVLDLSGTVRLADRRHMSLEGKDLSTHLGITDTLVSDHGAWDTVRMDEDGETREQVFLYHAGTFLVAGIANLSPVQALLFSVAMPGGTRMQLFDGDALRISNRQPARMDASNDVPVPAEVFTETSGRFAVKDTVNGPHFAAYQRLARTAGPW